MRVKFSKLVMVTGLGLFRSIASFCSIENDHPFVPIGRAPRSGNQGCRREGGGTGIAWCGLSSGRAACGKPLARICEGESRMAELLDR
jgi:hypothetical protein